MGKVRSCNPNRITGTSWLLHNACCHLLMLS